MKENDKKYIDVINVLLPVMLMTLTSLLLLNTINLTYVQQGRRNTKLNFYSCPTALDRSLRVYIYIYVYNNDNRQMHRFFSFFSFFFFFPVLITRATASVYSHEADGGTLHLIYARICLLNRMNGKKKKKTYIQSNRVIMRRKRKKKMFCSVCISYQLIQNRFNQIDR